MSYSYSVSDAQLAAYAGTSIAQRLAWLEDMRTTVWQLATPAVREAWALARDRRAHPAPAWCGLRGQARARVWRGDAEALSYPARSVQASVIATTSPALAPEVRAMTIEYARHAGPTLIGALLGATFRPSHGDAVTVRIHLGADDGPSWPAALLERTHIGLPAFAAEALARNAEAAAGLGPGVLDVHRAAHDEVGSSASSFVALFRALCAALAAPAERVDDVIGALL